MSGPREPVIVAGVDGSPRSLPVLRWADEQAQLTGTRLVAVTAYGSEPGAHGWPDDSAAVAAQKALDAAIAAALPPARAAEVEARIEPQTPGDALVAESEWAAVVVIGVHHLRALHPLRSVTARLVRDAQCPVVVVRRHRPVSSRRVVVGVNGTPSAQPALEWAARQAELLGGTVDAVLAWEWAPEYPVYPYGEGRGRVRAEHEALLARAVDRLPASLRGLVRARAVEGHPLQVLLDAVAGADLLVVGMDGHRTLADRVLGAVTERVVRHAPVPVVVVRSSVSVPATLGRRSPGTYGT